MQLVWLINVFLNETYS